MEYSMKDGLSQTLEKYKEAHEKLQQEASEMLKEHGEPDKQPSLMASAMSWTTTEMKMFMRDDNTQIAKIMMNGCNMGIQTIGEDISKYQQASKEAVQLAEKLIDLEERFASDIKEFL